jgi:hypothetical protein
MTRDAASTAKRQALDLISQLPDYVSTETIVAELQFKLLVLRRRESALRGNVITHEEAKQRLSRWYLS